MAFIGNSVQNQGFAPAVDYFNGDGTTVTYTLSRPVASVAQLTAVIENVIQNPSTAFTVSGNSITFTSAPPAGTNNIWVEYTSLITTYAAISQDPSVIGDITATGGYLSTGDFGNSYLDGTIVDYVTGMSRITTGASDGITLYNGGTSARTALMTLSAAGNVGVGTTTPYRQFQVGNYSGSAVMALGSNSSTGYGTICFATADSAPGRYIGLIEYGHSANYMGFTTNGTERMRIDSSGNVGIGTSSPVALLDVRGKLAISNSGSSYWQFDRNDSDGALQILDGTTERGQFDVSGNFKFNSGYGSVATAYGCRAWVSFNGTGTVAIRASGNVSSITDLGTGQYSVNFTTSMPDANYSVVGAAGGSTAGDSGLFGLSGVPSINTGSCKVLCIQPGVNVFDATHMMVGVFR